MSGLGKYNTKTITNVGAIVPKINFTNTLIKYEGDTAKVNATSDAEMDLADFTNGTEDYTSQAILNKIDVEIVKTDTETPWLAKVGATLCVGTTSVLSGVLDVAESIVDGGAWVASKVVGVFDKDAEKAMREFIAVDWVSKGNDALYGEGGLLEGVNDASSLKYDSEIAQSIRSAAEKTTVFVAATAATVCTGGAAAVALPLALGFAYGAGNQAENVYQQSTDTTISQELGVFVAGAGGAASWYAQGKMGEGLLNVASLVKDLGVKKTASMAAQGFKSLTSKTFPEIVKGAKDLVRGTFNKTTMTRALSKSIRDVKNIMQSVGIVADNVAGWLNGAEEFNAKNVLKACGELGIAWSTNVLSAAMSDYLTKAKRLDGLPNMTDEQKATVDEVFDAEHKNAQGKYEGSFRNYREHAELHTQAVRDYAVMLGLEVDGLSDEALAEIYYGAYFHDLGMEGGGLTDEGAQYGLNYKKKTTDFLGLIDDLDDTSEALGNATRDNHALNSALAVLREDVVPEGVDKDTVALLALSHSKSMSGVTSFASEDQWLDAIKRLENACDEYNIANGLSGDAALRIDGDKLRTLVETDFDRLQIEALCIRDGDAMSQLALTSDGHTIMQTGTYADVSYTARESFNTPVLSQAEEQATITDILHNSDGSVVGEVENKFSAMIHAGEENLDFDSTFTGTDYSGRVRLNDPNAVPNASLFSIEERIGEAATYSNCSTREFVIELPKEARNTALGNWYTGDNGAESPLQQFLAENADKALGKNDTSLAEFYRSGVKIKWV